MQRLRDASEQAKKELSSASSTNISLQYLSMSENGPIHLDETLTRAQFEQMTKDLLDRTKQPFHNVIKDAGIALSDIDHVVLVGGSTRMPAVSAARQGAHRRQGAQQGRQPRRGRRPRRVPPGRCPQGRAQGRPAHRRHAALARHRDQGWPVHQAHRAQHRDPDQAQRGLLDGRGQPALGAHPGLPGRARDRAAEQAARHLRALRHRAGPPRRAADRGHLRHRRQRHRPRDGQGPRHRPGAEDHHLRRVGPVEGGDRAHGQGRRGARRGGQGPPRGDRDPQPGRVARLLHREVPLGDRRQGLPRAAHAGRRGPRRAQGRHQARLGRVQGRHPGQDRHAQQQVPGDGRGDVRRGGRAGRVRRRAGRRVHRRRPAGDRRG